MTWQTTMGGTRKGTASSVMSVCRYVDVLYTSDQQDAASMPSLLLRVPACCPVTWQFVGWNCPEVSLSGRSFVLAFCKSQGGSTVVTLLPGALPIREGCCKTQNCHNFTLFHLLWTCMPSGNPGTAQVLTKTEEFADDLGSCSPWETSNVHYLWAVNWYIVGRVAQ